MSDVKQAFRHNAGQDILVSNLWHGGDRLRVQWMLSVLQ